MHVLMKKENLTKSICSSISMGDSVDDILSSMGLNKEEKSKYDTVNSKYTAQFVKGINVMVFYE